MEGNIQNRPNLDAHTSGTSNLNVACDNYGMFNHATKDCGRNFSEIHSTIDCKRCLASNLSSKLCAAQVENQSFFYIDECIDQRVTQEKASTVVITVTSGAINAKQIELEFMNLIGADAYRWHARAVADGKFLMRFPTAKMVTK